MPYTIKQDPIECNHYNTKVIVEAVIKNQNNHWIFNSNSADALHHNDPSGDYHELATILDMAFDDGGRLSHIQYNNFDEEMGTCLLAYIIKPEYSNHYQNLWDENVLDDNTTNHFQTFDGWYMSSHPSHVAVVWAGGY